MPSRNRTQSQSDYETNCKCHAVHYCSPVLYKLDTSVNNMFLKKAVETGWQFSAQDARCRYKLRTAAQTNDVLPQFVHGNH